MMDWFSAPNYSIARIVIERGLGIIYLVAFLVAFNQFVPLLGERGLLPVPQFMRGLGFWEAPSLFYFGYSDRRLKAVSIAGICLSLAIIVGLPQAGPLWVPMLVWFVLWVLYLSIVNVGQTFYGFGWESLLLEAGFLAIFLGNARTAPPFLVLLLFRWLAFRLELGAGLIKLRGDPCWRDLTCMYYHHETQPMPNPLSWYFHRLPLGFHRFEVLGSHAAQLVGPWLLFLPQPIAAVGGIMIIGTQAYLVVSGNYAWLNWLTILAAVSALPDGFFRALIPGVGTAVGLTPPLWFVVAVLALTVLVVVLSYWPVRNLLGSNQLMNYSFNRLHLVGTYGAFGSVTRQRYEVVVEGTDASEPTHDAHWREYEFRGKPGDPRRRPPQVAPYHLRLDWLMWFAALSSGYAAGWFHPFIGKLLEGDRATLRLLRRNPFPGKPPTWIRARYYSYRFTTWRERRETGAWWVRELMGEYLRPVRLARGARDGQATSGA
jgi:hypothetical protein